GGVIAYISSSSSGSSPESCHSDSSNGSYQSSSPPRAPRPAATARAAGGPALPGRCQTLPGTQKAGRASSAKCGITKIRGMVMMCKVCGDVIRLPLRRPRLRGL
ncbi:unnamed protein product, partial [Tetraodon nigroviridis]